MPGFGEPVEGWDGDAPVPIQQRHPRSPQARPGESSDDHDLHAERRHSSLRHPHSDAEEDQQRRHRLAARAARSQNRSHEHPDTPETQANREEGSFSATVSITFDDDETVVLVTPVPRIRIPPPPLGFRDGEMVAAYLRLSTLSFGILNAK